MNSILIIGKNGQVGKALLECCPEAVCWGREKIDLADPVSIRNAIRALRPKTIINAAAYTAVDKAEDEEQKAEKVNALGPEVLAEEANRLDSLLVHYSTDYVFDGNSRRGYREEDTPNPQSAYGRTKWKGDQAIMGVAKNYVIFRVGWVYHHTGNNFFLKILKKLTDGEQIRIVNDQIGTPSSASFIAQQTVRALNWRDDKNLDSGVYHLAPTGYGSWFEFGESIGKLWRSNHEKSQPSLQIQSVESAAFPTKAKRPMYSVLDSSRFVESFQVELPVWTEVLFDVWKRWHSCESA